MVWAGDVCDIIPVLRECRPNLDQTEINCRSTDLALINNADPHYAVLEESYEEIVAKDPEMSINEFGRDTLAEALTIASQSEPSLTSCFGSGV